MLSVSALTLGRARGGDDASELEEADGECGGSSSDSAAGERARDARAGLMWHTRVCGDEDDSAARRAAIAAAASCTAASASAFDGRAVASASRALVLDFPLAQALALVWSPGSTTTSTPGCRRLSRFGVAASAAVATDSEADTDEADDDATESDDADDDRVVEDDDDDVGRAGCFDAADVASVASAVASAAAATRSDSDGADDTVRSSPAGFCAALAGGCGE